MNTIAATATSTGLTVTAVLDACRYPVGAEVTGAQMKEHEEPGHHPARLPRRLERTLLAVPRPAPDPGGARRRAARPPGRGPGRPGPARAHRPAARRRRRLAAVLAEARLRAARGGRDRQRPPTAGNDSRQKITFTGHVLAAILHQRFNLPASAIAALLGCDRSTIGHELPRTRQLLAATATAIPPAPLTLATCQDLRDHAAVATVSPCPPRQTARPQPATLATPGTPQTHLKKGRVLNWGQGPPHLIKCELGGRPGAG